MYYCQHSASFFGAYCAILMENFKVLSAQQAKSVNNYKNTKYRLPKNNAAVCCNKISRRGHPTPKYINITLKDVEPNMVF